jgi:hypothetical protein
VVFQGSSNGMATVEEIAALIILALVNSDLVNSDLVDGFAGAIAQGRFSRRLAPGGNRP